MKMAVNLKQEAEAEADADAERCEREKRTQETSLSATQFCSAIYILYFLIISNYQLLLKMLLECNNTSISKCIFSCEKRIIIDIGMR